MLTQVPFSAYAICYVPLALVILGFIGFAYLTDVDARRTYLRDMDTRPDDELTPADVLAKRKVRTAMMQAEIPSGPRVVLGPDEGSGAAVATPPPPVAAAAPPPPPPAAAPKVEVEEKIEDSPKAESESGSGTTVVADDLTIIEGIGPKMNQALQAQGIRTFAELASKSLDDLRTALEEQGITFVPSAESWAEQASFAAKGDMDGLKALQDTLESGRYPKKD